MRRIVVSLLKGGVAKSETAVHLAHGLALLGKKVLLVDTDVQSHCAEMLGQTPEKGLADLIAGWANPAAVLAKARDNLWLLAGGTDLAAVKMEIARREMAPEAVLSEALSCYEGRFDYLIMDTAPGWDTLLVNALYCSREVLSPVSMEPMAINGLMRFQERLAVIQKYNPHLVLKWIVPTFVDGRVKKSGEILEQLKERYGDLIGPPIRYSVKLSEATAFGQTIYEHDPNGSGAKSYRKLVKAVLASPSPEQAEPLARLKAATGQVPPRPTEEELIRPISVFRSVEKKVERSAPPSVSLAAIPSRPPEVDDQVARPIDTAGRPAEIVRKPATPSETTPSTGTSGSEQPYPAVSPSKAVPPPEPVSQTGSQSGRPAVTLSLRERLQAKEPPVKPARPKGEGSPLVEPESGRLGLRERLLRAEAARDPSIKEARKAWAGPTGDK